MIQKDFNFKSGEETISAFMTVSNETTKPTCLILHGAGLSDKERLRGLASSMLKIGISSIGFDYSGSGDSTNNSPQSIKKRTKEAKSALELLDKTNPYIISAFSMSGQVAINLIEEFGNSIGNLILFAPAIYDKRALDVDFGPEFSNIIRTEKSWLNNNVQNALLNYEGGILIFMSDHDDIIPAEIPDIIIASAVDSKRKQVHYLIDAPHQLAQWTNMKVENAELISTKICDFIKDDKPKNESKIINK